LVYLEIQPNSFSFNSPEGACPVCDGLGECVAEELTSTQPEHDKMDELLAEDRFLPEVCPECQGSRLNAHARSVFLGHDSLATLVNLSIADLQQVVEKLIFSDAESPVAKPLVKEIQSRLAFLVRTGVEYLSLGRNASSLSGGEYQRVRLANSIGSGLTNIGYILDEPSVGLHPRDSQRLIDSIRELQRTGNSVILVEHDEATIRQADYVIDMGPLAGKFGGNVVAAGSPEDIAASLESPTGGYLSGRTRVVENKNRQTRTQHHWLRLNQASGRNLKQVDLEVPLGLFTVVTGVSGSGKSTLINQTLAPALTNLIRKRTGQTAQAELTCLPFLSVEGADLIDRVVTVDQRPLSQSVRGCPATAMGIFDSIRKIFSATKRAKQLGFGSARFSFNSKTGWCPDCRGLGCKRIQMNVIPDFYISCDSCRGTRFNLQTLQVRFNDHSIADVLNLSVVQAREFFDGFESIARSLQALLDVGLGYLQLGQSTRSLSGGEAQRVKLANELVAKSNGHTMYILDEPTTGLHFSDLRVLLLALNRLVDCGHSLIVIEHNLDVIRSADWIIDIGPEGGDRGGRILASGTLEQIRQQSNSHTAKFL
jgi:excinuclease ABC subunit A